MTKSAEDIFKELKTDVVKPFLFYIPYDVLPEEAKNIVNKDQLLKSVLNRIISVSNNYELEVDKLYLNQLHHINKSSSLEVLLIRLLELRDNSSEHLFKIIFEKYKNLLLGLEYVSRWMIDNFETYFNPEEYESQKNCFQIQAVAFTEHLKEIEKEFYTQPIAKIKQQQITSIFKNEFSNVEFKTNSQPVPVIENTTTTTPKKKKSPVTAEEAKNYLLVNVFGIGENLLGKNSI